jgi:hypothetical protein
MATLPRYQQMGIQYGDLPRVSTAGIDVAAKAMDSIGSQIDRMSNFVYQQGTTEAQRKSKQYAIQNPPTKEQLREAVETGRFPRIKGAGRVFQETYEKTQAGLLSTELQLDINKALTAINATIESGQAVDLNSIESEIRDRIDGYTATIMSLDADQGLRFKAAATAAGNSIFQKAADRAVKVYQAQNDARFASAIIDIQPVLESVYAIAGSIDPETGKPRDLDALIDVHRQPFLDSVAIVGHNRHLLDFEKANVQAKKNALTAFMTDRANADTAPQAIRRIQSGDFGNLSDVFKGLPNDEKQRLETEIMSSFSREYTAETQQAALEKQQMQEQWQTMSLTLLNPGASEVAKQDVVRWGVANGMITVQTGNALLRPEPGTGDVVLEARINDAINRRTITTLDELYQYRGQLTESQFKSVAQNLTSKQHSFANTYIRNAAGVTEQAWITPQRNNEYQAILEIYENVLQEQVPNAQGVMVNISPLEAARRAVAEHKGNPQVQSAKGMIEQNKTNITNVLQKNGIHIPQNVAIEELDVTKMRGLSGAERTNIENWQEAIRNQTQLLGPNSRTR